MNVGKMDVNHRIFLLFYLLLLSFLHSTKASAQKQVYLSYYDSPTDGEKRYYANGIGINKNEYFKILGMEDYSNSMLRNEHLVTISSLVGSAFIIGSLVELYKSDSERNSTIYFSTGMLFSATAVLAGLNLSNLKTKLNDAHNLVYFNNNMQYLSSKRGLLNSYFTVNGKKISEEELSSYLKGTSFYYTFSDYAKWGRKSKYAKITAICTMGILISSTYAKESDFNEMLGYGMTLTLGFSTYLSYKYNNRKIKKRRKLIDDINMYQIRN